MKKKLMSLVLAMAMILSALPAATAANVEPLSENAGKTIPVQVAQGDTDSLMSASAISGIINQKLLNKNVATIQLKYLGSGETSYVELLPSAFSVERVSKNIKGETETTLGCKIFIDMETGKVSANDGVECSTHSSEGNYKEKSGITAYLNVTYTISNDLEYIKTTNFNGRWELPNNLYYLSNREVGIHQGTFNASNLQEKIATNSFNYNLDWPYEGRMPNGDCQARGWSEATIWIAGMENSGGIVLSIDLPYGSIE